MVGYYLGSPRVAGLVALKLTWRGNCHSKCPFGGRDYPSLVLRLSTGRRHTSPPCRTHAWPSPMFGTSIIGFVCYPPRVSLHHIYIYFFSLANCFFGLVQLSRAFATDCLATTSALWKSVQPRSQFLVAAQRNARPGSRRTTKR